MVDTFFIELATLMRRSTVQKLPPQLVFPGSGPDQLNGVIGSILEGSLMMGDLNHVMKTLVAPFNRSTVANLYLEPGIHYAH